MVGAVCEAADVLARLRPGTRPALEVRVAIIGNVDSGETGTRQALLNLGFRLHLGFNPKPWSATLI